MTAGRASPEHRLRRRARGAETLGMAFLWTNELAAQLGCAPMVADMAASYTDAQRDAALDAVDAAVEAGQSVNQALKAVAAEHSVPVSTLKSWRRRYGRSERVGTPTEAAAHGAAAAVAKADAAMSELLDAGREFVAVARGLVGEPDQSRAAADTLRAGNAAIGTVVDKMLKRGQLESVAEKHEVTTTVDVSKLSDDELARLAEGMK